MKTFQIIAIVLVLFIIFILINISQTRQKLFVQNEVVISDTTLANEYFEKAERCYNQSKFDSCIHFYKKASIEYEHLRNYKKHVLCLHNIGRVYHYFKEDQRKALQYYQFAINCSFEKLGINSIMEAQCYYRIADIYTHYDGDIYVTNLRDSLSNKFLKKSKSILENYIPNNIKEVADQNYYLGLTYILSNKYKEALEFFKKAQNQYTGLFGYDSKQVGYCLKRIGWPLAYMNMPDEALEYANKSLTILSRIYDKNNPEIGYVHNLISYIYFMKFDFNNAIINDNKAASIFIENHMELNFAECYTSIGFSYLRQKNFHKSIEYYDKALIIFKKNNKYNSISDCYIYLANAKSQTGNYHDADTNFKQALTLKKRLFNENSIELFNLYFYLISHYADIGDYKNEIKFCSKLLQLPFNLEIYEHRFYKLVTLLRLTFVNSQKGDYENAYNYLLEAEYLIKNNFSSNLSDDLNYMYFSTAGFYYYKISEINEAIDYLNKALILRDKLEPDFYGAVVNYLIQAFNENGAYTESLKTFQQYLKYPKFTFIIPGVNIRINLNHARALIALNKIKKAEIYLNKGLSECKSIFGKKNTFISQYYLELGKIYRQKDDIKKALYYFQKSIKSVVYEFDSDQINLNPSLKNIFSEIDLLNALILKAISLKDYYLEISRDLNDLIISFNTYDLAIELIGDIKNGYKSESAKYQFSELNQNIYQDAIYTAFELYEITYEKRYIEKAFLIAEKSKASVLQQMLTESKAKKFAGIPDSLLEKEKFLKQESGFYDYLIYEENNNGNKADSIKLKLWQNELLNKKKQYDDLINLFNTNYPDYYNLKTQFNAVSFDKLQNDFLNDSTIIIEYFLGNEFLYIFSISKYSYEMVKINHNSLLHQKIKSLRLSLVSRDKNNYSNIAYELYEIFIKPVKDIIMYKKMIIIPDGILGYIPFEVLLTEKSDDKESNYKNYPYLIKDYQISYSYSAKLLLDKDKNLNPRKELNFVGFAPVKFK